jgi:hypothetical protein
MHRTVAVTVQSRWVGSAQHILRWQHRVDNIKYLGCKSKWVMHDTFKWQHQAGSFKQNGNYGQ